MNRTEGSGEGMCVIHGPGHAGQPCPDKKSVAVETEDSGTIPEWIKDIGLKIDDSEYGASIRYILEDKLEEYLLTQQELVGLTEENKAALGGIIGNLVDDRGQGPNPEDGVFILDERVAKYEYAHGEDQSDDRTFNDFYPEILSKMIPKIIYFVREKLMSSSK